MTKEEALKIIDNIPTKGDEVDALEMAIKALEQQPCGDAISRSEAIRMASGYCHWTNIPDELAKLPSVNPKPCEDAISRQAAIEGLARIAKAKAKSDAQKSLMGRVMFFTEKLPSVSTEKTGRWIPVSEKLPEDGTWNMFTDGKQISVERFKLDAINHFFPEGRWFSFDEAVAWMTLPQPFEPQESEE